MTQRDEARREAEVRALFAERPRSRFLRASTVLLLALAVGAWFSNAVDVRDLFSARRAANLERFLRQDALPRPLREGGGLQDLLAWIGEILSGRGLEGLLATLWISLAAIVLAGALALVAAPFGARTLMRPDPYGPERPSRAYRLAAALVRGGFVLMRAVPEYVLAFLFLAMLRGGAWPAVLALALHNGGILGRLGADTIENLDPGPLRALVQVGARRPALLATATYPMTSGRLLLYFFYRFESCVREATVLGLLGIVSLGYWIQDARARQNHDEMILLVALGALLVAAADVVSILARRFLRRSGG